MGLSTFEIILNFPTSIISLKVFSNFHLLGSKNQNLFPWYDSFYSSCFSVMFCFCFCFVLFFMLLIFTIVGELYMKGKRVRKLLKLKFPFYYSVKSVNFFSITTPSVK